MILQQAGHGESVTRDCGMGSAGLPAGPGSPGPAMLGARAHAHLSRFTAGAVHWATGPPGLGGKWEPSLVARPPRATEMQMLVAARQPAGTRPGLLADISGQICLIGGCAVCRPWPCTAG